MKLEEFFKAHPKESVAFWGVEDSAYLLYAAARCGANVRAYYVRSDFQPQFELEDAERLAGQLGTPVTVLRLDVLSSGPVAENPPDRCYHCKKAIFGAIIEAAAR